SDLDRRARAAPKGPAGAAHLHPGQPALRHHAAVRAPGAIAHVASLEAESHLLWEMFHDLPAARFSSHEVGPEDITRRERKVLYFAIDRVAAGRRYLDKAPRNCLRVPYLDAMFPGAWFVHLKRDGRAAVS